MVPRTPCRRPCSGQDSRGLTGRLLRSALVVLLALAALLAVSPGTASAVAVPTPPAVAPVEPVAPAGSPQPVPSSSGSPRPSTPLDLDGANGALSNPLALVLLLGALSLLPALLIMVTAFTRIVIVLGFTRTALGTQGVPPNQVLIGLALFLTLFVMGPVFSQANDEGLQPYLKGEIGQGEAFDKVLEPFRGFMLEQVREEDLQLFVDLSDKPQPENASDVPTTTLVPAFVISELRAAFLIGFVIFIPFVVIDLVVSAALSAMGMAMLPPSLISLPFKLLLFVAVDGWSLIVQSLVRSFA